MNKVLILGAKGNLGSCLLKSFADLKPLAWDREELDLRDFSITAEALEKAKPTLIINTVAYNAVDLCEEQDQEYQQALALNRDLPKFLGAWCLKESAQLIHYSSDYVFSSEQLDFPGFDESASPKPINRYGQSKLAGEKELLDLADQGLDYYIIRTSKLFGPLPLSLTAKPNFFDLMIKLASKNDELKIVDGERSCFTYTPDLAVATRALIDDKVDRGYYHLINEKPATWLEGAQFLFELLKLNPKIKTINSRDLVRPAKRPSSSVLINSRRPKLRSWQSALREYYL